jgi:serine/threonine protein kinase
LLPLARGGMGTVVLARAARGRSFERLVAIKLCHEHLVEDPEFVTMFEDEAKLSALIRHANVVPTLDVGAQGGVPYLVMEYVEGVRVADLLREGELRGARIPPSIVARIVLDALLGLEAAHEAQDLAGEPLHLVHRDVSPQNLLVGSDGVTRLLDFGVAKARARATHTTGQGGFKGKLGYAAPEQLRGESDRRTDLFAMGVVLWELLAGRRLFRGRTETETVAALLYGGVPQVEVAAIDPSKLEALLAAALAREPSDRVPTASRLAHLMGACFPAIASPREVQALVESWHGSELSKRRREIAERVRALGVSSEARAKAPTHSETPASEPHRAPPTHSSPDEVPRTPGPARSEVPNLPTRARYLRGIAVAAAVILAAGGAITLASSRPGVESREPPTASEPEASVVRARPESSAPRGTDAPDAQAVLRREQDRPLEASEALEQPGDPAQGADSTSERAGRSSNPDALAPEHAVGSPRARRAGRRREQARPAGEYLPGSL